jgi:hypothetical protein
MPAGAKHLVRPTTAANAAVQSIGRRPVQTTDTDARAARCSRQRLSGDRTESPSAGDQQRRRRRGLGGEARSHESCRGRRPVADATGLASSHATMSEALSQNSSKGSRLTIRH